MTNTINAHTKYVIWLRSHRCYELANMHNQGDLLCQGVLNDVLLEQYRLPLCEPIVRTGILDTVTELYLEWSFRRTLEPNHYRWDKCDHCGEKGTLGLVEKTGYEGWLCADCYEPPKEYTSYEAVPWKMGLDASCLYTCQHCTLPVAECECHERGRD